MKLCQLCPTEKPRRAGWDVSLRATDRHVYVCQSHYEHMDRRLIGVAKEIPMLPESRESDYTWTT